MEGLWISVRDELESVREEAARVAQACKQWQDGNRTGGFDDWLYVGALPWGVQAAYGGMERVLAIIGCRFDGWGDQGERSSGRLLRTMQQDNPGVRPAVISEACCQALNELCEFRQALWHGRGSDLGPDRVVGCVSKLAVAVKLFEKEIGEFGSRMGFEDGGSEPSGKSPGRESGG